jgi:hypothetical protein
MVEKYCNLYSVEMWWSVGAKWITLTSLFITGSAQRYFHHFFLPSPPPPTLPRQLAKIKSETRIFCVNALPKIVQDVRYSAPFCKH